MPRPLLFAVALVVLLLVAWLLPVAEYLQSALGWIAENRSVSWVVYILLYVVATVLLLPGSIITIAAGFLFGLGYGFALVSFSSVLGATCAFLIGRYFARDWVEDKLQAMPRFAALDAAIAQRGPVVVLLTRLSPVFPFNLLNYALGLTAVKLPHFVLLSWIGMMPGTLLFVYLGTAVGDLSAVFAGEVDAGEFGGWLFYVGLGATLLLTVFITRMATTALTERLDENETATEGAE